MNFTQDFNNVPEELKSQKRWVEIENNSKRPIDGIGWNTPKKQKNFDEISGRKAFVISRCGITDRADYFVLDFDNVLKEDGKFINDTAERIFNLCAGTTFGEKSSSGRGYHFFFRPSAGKTFKIDGKDLDGKKDISFGYITVKNPETGEEKPKKSHLEIFYKGSNYYFILTGDVEDVEGNFKEITSGEDANKIIAQILAEIDKEKAGTKPAEEKTDNFKTSEEEKQENSSSSSSDFDYTKARTHAKFMLDAIAPVKLDRDTWWQVGRHLHDLGFSYDVFDEWNHRDPERCKTEEQERENRDQWDDYKDGDPKKAIISLYCLAKKFGYTDEEMEKLLKTENQKAKETEKEKGGFEPSEDNFMRANSPTSAKEKICAKRLEREKFSSRKCGFTELDKVQRFSPGVFVLGGLPGTGKTTGAWQVCENFAKIGEYVIFISYEMEDVELFAKSFSRRLAERIDKEKLPESWKLSANEILDGKLDVKHEGILTKDESELWEKEREIEEEFFSENLPLAVYNAETETIDEILKVIDAEIKKAEKPPIVCLDYLQNIPHGKDTEKAGIDEIVTKLKNYQKKTGTTFIIISSLNRASYKDATLSAFKESGKIEFSADVVLLMQKKAGEEEDWEGGRDIILKNLKNRKGASNYEIEFRYYPAYDLFKEDE